MDSGNYNLKKGLYSIFALVAVLIVLFLISLFISKDSVKNKQVEKNIPKSKIRLTNEEKKTIEESFGTMDSTQNTVSSKLKKQIEKNFKTNFKSVNTLTDEEKKAIEESFKVK